MRDEMNQMKKPSIFFGAAVALVLSLLMSMSALAQTPLADRPVYDSDVKGNVALALSVEFPTGETTAYKDIAYNKNQTFLGYFDDKKCYQYQSSNNYLAVDLFSTGVDDSRNVLAANKNDTHWSLVGYPSGTTRWQRRRLNDTSDSYQTTTAKYIGWPAGSVPSGQYQYESDLFTFPASVNPRDVKITFDLMVDDQLVDILINGASTGITSSASWNNAETVTIPKGAFSAQSNRLTIVTNNTGGPGGMRVDQIKVIEDGATNYGEYFIPVAMASGHSCRSVSNGRWSGNFLNWALMPVIDSFRKNLTGGHRDVDTADKTILQKGYLNSNLIEAFGLGTNEHRILTGTSVVRDATPFDHWSSLTLRIKRLGTHFYVSSSANIDSPSSVSPGINAKAEQNANAVYDFAGRVEACVPGLLEAWCKLYPSGYYKPEGLIQTNAENLRFSAFGYLFDENIKRDGGVLRARMASIAPGGEVPEWDSNTGVFLSNPSPADATASGVSNSGVINYLNKFGLSAQEYKQYDSVGELFYTVGRYFRNKGNVSEYSNLTGDAANQEKQKDGFPVITNWDDPIKRSCDPNFIIGIGDTNSHADSNLPGSQISSGYEPAMPSSVSSDYGSVTDTSNNFTDVYTSTKRVGDLEGISNLQSLHPWWCCSQNTYFMSGLAYDWHTRDIRADLSGKQTIDTYWLDVLESGFRSRNQYWLAAKYGGFEVADDFEPYGATITPLATSDWDADNDGDPDNYYRADDPAKMQQGLANAFDSIVSAVDQTSTGFALTNPNVLAGDKSYAASYSSGFWHGTVIGSSLTFDTNGNPIETEVWSTDTVFEAQLSGTGWDSQRKIITSNCVDLSYGQKQCTSVPFRYGSLNTANSTYLSTVSTYTGVGQEVLNYLRGDRSNESKYRSRSKVLGDIVHSRLAPISQPNAPYSDAYNPGYSAFKSNYQNRQTVVYVGANDGMLHAFNGDTGTELFAYVPQALYKGHDGDTQANGLVALADPGYQHRYYVDASPAFYDVNFGAGDSDWHTLLLTGLGKGGKSYFALDVTDPASITTESTAASKFLWEFSHQDLGFTYGRPISAKVDGKWVVIFTSGYNNQDGKGYFFIVDPKTGTLINKVSTGVGSTSSDAGLAHLTAYVADGKSFEADAVYAGDLQGNLWRLDLKGAATAGYSKTPERIATLKSSNGDAQAVTTSPIVELDQITKERIVFVGTGRLLDQSDLPVTAINTIYAIKDGDQAAFYTTATLPSPVSAFPINPRSVMVNHTGNAGEVTADSSKPMGYYIDMPAGFYINAPMVSGAGVFAAFANKIVGDVCDRNSVFRGYVLNYASGKSLITNTNTGLTTQYLEGQGLASGVTIYKQPTNNNLSVNFRHDGSGGNSSVEVSPAGSVFKVLNWRLVPIE